MKAAVVSLLGPALVGAFLEVDPSLLGDQDLDIQMDLEESLQAPPAGITALIDNGMVVDCEDTATFPGSWNGDGCLRGAEADRWCVAKDGKQNPCPAGVCDNPLWGCNLTKGIAQWPHAYIAPAKGVTPTGDLVVFMPGTGGTWYGYQRLLKAAAKAGHHVLGLTYMSQPFPSAAANRWCDPSPPGYVSTPWECNSEIHEQMLFGSEAPNVQAMFAGKSGRIWPVPRKYSVEELVKAAVTKTVGGVNWGKDFLDGDKVVWDKIIISGHSQGASHAAYLSQQRGVRSMLISGPQDSYSSAEKWLTIPVQAMPNTKRRSLHHDFEECAAQPATPATYCQAQLLPDNLALMGFGAPAYWDGKEGTPLPANLNNVVSRAAFTDSCTSGRTWHTSTAADYCAISSYDALWEAMFRDFGPEAPKAPPTPAPPAEDVARTSACAGLMVLGLSIALLLDGVH